jgi:hypothetical protein
MHKAKPNCITKIDAHVDLEHLQWRIKTDEQLGVPVNLHKVKGHKSSEFNELTRWNDDGHPIAQSTDEGCGRWDASPSPSSSRSASPDQDS